MRNPCRDCRERRAGGKDIPPCHSGCERYRAWREELVAGKAEENAGRDAREMAYRRKLKREKYILRHTIKRGR